MRAPAWTVWLTGRPASGKTTLAQALADALRARGAEVEILDGDALRETLSRDLGFTREDRDENVRRTAVVAEMLNRHGVVAIVALVSPYERAREEARGRLRMALVHVDCPTATLLERDPKGLYRRSGTGELTGLTGVDDPYEEPRSADVLVRTDRERPAESAQLIVRRLEEMRLLPLG